MPAGFTHILLVKNFNEKSRNIDLELEALLDDKMKNCGELRPYLTEEKYCGYIRLRSLHCRKKIDGSQFQFCLKSKRWAFKSFKREI